MNLKTNLRKHWLLVFFVFVMIVDSLYSYLTKGIIYYIVTGDLNNVVSYINNFGIYAWLVFIVLIIAEVIVAPVPAWALYVASGILFGTFLGGTLALAGNIIGAVIAFYIAKKFGRHYVEKMIDTEAEKKFDKFVEKHGTFAIFLLRVNPFTSSDMVSYLAGLTKMRISTFTIGTILGLAPVIYLQSYLGGDIINNNPVLGAMFIWVSIGYIIGFFILIEYLSQKKKHRDKNLKLSK